MASLPPTTPGALGPDDGDPNTPVVALPDVTCGGPKGFGTTNLQIDMRDLILTYPCNKHEGANVTFILLLHGTNSNEASKLYTHSYFAAWQLASTDNLIIAEPKSKASQWGNTKENRGRSPKDKPYLGRRDRLRLQELRPEVQHHQPLGRRADSRAAMYAGCFVCDRNDQRSCARRDRYVGRHHGRRPVADLQCTSVADHHVDHQHAADYISQIHTVGDMDMVTGLPDQTAAATKHGCGAKMGPTDIGNMQMLDEWPGCSPGRAARGLHHGRSHAHDGDQSRKS